MGRYNVKNSKQDLSGISTLTNNPIAKFNIVYESTASGSNNFFQEKIYATKEDKDFKVGDRVICNDDGCGGTVLETDKSGCVVLFDNTEQTWIEYWQISKE